MITQHKFGAVKHPQETPSKNFLFFAIYINLFNGDSWLMCDSHNLHLMSPNRITQVWPKKHQKGFSLRGFWSRRDLNPWARPVMWNKSGHVWLCSRGGESGGKKILAKSLMSPAFRWGGGGGGAWRSCTINKTFLQENNNVSAGWSRVRQIRIRSVDSHRYKAKHTNKTMKKKKKTGNRGDKY